MNFKFRFYRFFTGLSFCVVMGDTLAAELEISVFPDEALSRSGLTACSPERVSPCAATLTDAVALTQNLQWQASATAQYSLIRLKLAAGTYRLSNPLLINWTGNNNVKLEIAGTGAGASNQIQTLISGATSIQGWSLLAERDLPARVAKNARGKLWVADVSSYKLPLNQLPQPRGYGLPQKPVMTEFFTTTGAQTLAGWPNNGYSTLLRSSSLPSSDQKSFEIEGRSVSDWADEPDLQVFGYWYWDWASQTYLIDQKNSRTNLLTLQGQGSPYGIKHGQRIRVIGALAELDSPGEWYLDRFNAKLYYWPVTTFPDSLQELSLAEVLLQVNNAQKISVHDIKFEKSRGDAIQVMNSNEIVFDRIAISFTGNRAVNIQNSKLSGIRNSTIEDSGEGGVLLDGGDRQTLTAAGNFVDTSTIRRFSRLMKTSRFAVEINGVGQRVANTVIADGPHSAIFFKGNDHKITSNEIFNVVTETSDAGAIYTGRDYTSRGTVIDRNYFHDIKSYAAGSEVKGIYLDDQSSGTIVRGNLFARVQQPVFIGGGRDNIVDSNLFYQSSPSVHIDARGLYGGPTGETLDPNGTLQKGLDAVPYRTPPYSTKYANLANLREDDIGAPKYNRITNNKIIGGTTSSIENIALKWIYQANNSVATEDVFIEAPGSSMRLKPSSFNLKSGFWKNSQGYSMPPSGILLLPNIR